MDFIWNKIQFVITDLGGGKLGEKIPMHVHAKGCYELHFITEGKGTLIADGREIELKKNDFFITGPNIRHSQNYDEQSPIEDVFVLIQIAISFATFIDGSILFFSSKLIYCLEISIFSTSFACVILFFLSSFILFFIPLLSFHFKYISLQ